MNVLEIISTLVLPLGHFSNTIKILSYGRRLVLINALLTSLPMFMLSFFELPKGIQKQMDCYRFIFLWQCDEHKWKYRLTKRSIICKPKEQGALGVEDLAIKNKCLLSKWFFKLLNGDVVWQELL